MTPDELRERREALHLTQAQLAEAISVRQHHLSRWETGAVPITAIRAAWLDQELRRLEHQRDG
jgi:transcriptional regulator with XRE-family HTH domain